MGNACTTKPNKYSYKSKNPKQAEASAAVPMATATATTAVPTRNIQGQKSAQYFTQPVSQPQQKDTIGWGLNNKTEMEILRHASHIQHKHKFPVIQSLRSNDLYRSRINSLNERKTTLDSIPNSAGAIASQPKRITTNSANANTGLSRYSISTNQIISRNNSASV